MKVVNMGESGVVICANCKYYSGHLGQLCERVENINEDIISGKRWMSDISCIYERQSENLCGYSGKYFIAAGSIKKFFHKATSWVSLPLSEF